MTSTFVHPNHQVWARLVHDVRNEVLMSRTFMRQYPGIVADGRQSAVGSDDLFRDGAWDVLKFTAPHTAGPHFTLASGNEWFQVLMVVPNRVRKPHSKLGSFLRMHRQPFTDALAQAQANGPPGSVGFRGVQQPVLFLLAKQRHFHAQRYGRVDGFLTFKADVFLPRQACRDPKVKPGTVWLDMIESLLDEPSKNIELQIVWNWSWDRDPPSVQALAVEAVHALVALKTAWAILDNALTETPSP